MSARAALFTLLSQDTELTETVGIEAVYPTNAVDTPPEELFLIIRWEPVELAFKDRGTGRVTIWAHDRQRDYGRIDAALQRLKDLIPATVHRAGADGWTLTTAEWNGEGPDLFDAGYQTVTRFAEFNVISRYTAS